MAEQTEPGIVDDKLDLHPCSGQGGGDLIAGIGLFEIAGDQDRGRTAGNADFGGQRRQAIRAARHQREAMAIGSENAGQFGTYSSRGTGNQRHTLSHDSILVNKWQDMPTTAAYALGGMQAACKHFGVFKTAMRQN